MHILRKTLSFAVCAAALAVVAGCAKKEPELPLNTELTVAFGEVLDARGYDPEISSVELFCEKKPGPIKVKVNFVVAGNDMKAAFVSTTPCLEEGVLVTAASSDGRRHLLDFPSNYLVRSKQPYDKALVVAEWEKALNSELGTFAYNKTSSEAVMSSHLQPLVDLAVEDVKFACHAPSKKITYNAYYQGGWRTGATTIACPAVSDKSELVARLLQRQNYNSSTGPKNSYSMFTVKSVDSETASSLVRDFLRAAGRHNSF